jgi:hypothetical protein
VEADHHLRRIVGKERNHQLTLRGTQAAADSKTNTAAVCISQ